MQEDEKLLEPVTAVEYFFFSFKGVNPVILEASRLIIVERSLPSWRPNKSTHYVLTVCNSFTCEIRYMYRHKFIITPSKHVSVLMY